MFTFFNTKAKRVYLDNAGATKVSDKAKRALVDSLDVFGNPSAIHQEGDKASHALQKARNSIATSLNAHSYEITFVGTGTESCNLAIMGTITSVSGSTKPHIITSVIEHPAVLEPIRNLEKEGKVEVTYLPVYEQGIVKVSDVRDAIREETVLVSIMYANNEIGTIQPVKEIGRLLDEWKRNHERTFTSYPYFHVDACQAGNYLSLDVLRLKCHFMSINSSKVYGPKGVAVLYKREGIKLLPSVYGGGQERGLRSGTESIALATSFAVALTESQNMKESESERLIALRDFFFEKIAQEIPDVTIYGDHKDRLPNNINIRIPGILSDEMILRLDVKGFAVSHKSACASQETDGSYVVQALGATVEESLENVRITLGRDTAKTDMEALVSAIKEIKIKFAK
ncbi:MAG: cysteine desulfurase family protein [Candidatus Paceibacterota bacterium]